MKVLVMGGTRFNGLALVHELRRHGHAVTIFNRGQTEAAIPRGVRRLLGDRKDHASMAAVFAGEEFDCVFDISAYTPDDVRGMIEIFRGRTGHYVFASSTVIYAASKVLPISEDSPVDRSHVLPLILHLKIQTFRPGFFIRAILIASYVKEPLPPGIDCFRIEPNRSRSKPDARDASLAD